MKESDFQQTVPYLFNRLSNIFRNHFDKQLQKLNLHGGQVFILLELWQEDGLSQTKLAENLRLTSPTVHKMVRSLVQRGFIECRICPADNRLKRIFLTDPAWKIKPDLEHIWHLVEAEMLDTLSETEKLIFRQLLQNLVRTSFQTGSK